VLGLFCRAEQSDSGISSRAIGGDEITGIGHSVLMAVSLLSPIPQHYKWPGCGLRDASAVIQRKKTVGGLKCLKTRQMGFRVSKRDDPQIMDLRERQKRGGHMRQFWLGRAGQQVSIVVGRCGRMIYSELAGRRRACEADAI
jgi:hypothetical protein